MYQSNKPPRLQRQRIMRSAGITASIHTHFLRHISGWWFPFSDILKPRTRSGFNSLTNRHSCRVDPVAHCSWELWNRLQAMPSPWGHCALPNYVHQNCVFCHRSAQIIILRVWQRYQKDSYGDRLFRQPIMTGNQSHYNALFKATGLLWQKH